MSSETNGKHRALLVPADLRQPITVVQAGDEDYRTLVFGEDHPDPVLSFSSIRQRRMQVCYDDLGLYRPSQPPNDRARRLWGALAGVSMHNMSHLVGNFVFLGLDPQGETIDVSDEVVELAKDVDDVERLHLGDVGGRCPVAPYFDYHHFIPQMVAHEGQILVCRYCEKSEQELREQ